MKKILCFVLAAVLVLCCFASCNSDNQSSSQGGDSSSQADNSGSGSTGDGEKNENKVIMGNSTDLSGDFRWPGFGSSSAGASDQDIGRLTVGHATMAPNQGGAYVWDETVVKEHTEVEDENGNLVITIEINPGLKFSDGTEIKAENYLAYLLAFSTKIAQNAGHSAQVGQSYVGFNTFAAYMGEDVDYAALAEYRAKAAALTALQEENPDATMEDVVLEEAVAPITATKEFSGIRLLGDYKFSLTINAAGGYYPYYFANTYGAVSPYPMAQVLGEGVELKDDGNGCYLSESWYEKAADSNIEEDAATFTKTDHLTKARYDVSTYPFSGPYVIKEWDSGTKQATLEINPEYAGNFEGVKPQIKTIVYIKLTSETQLEMLKTGGTDIIGGITGGEDTKDVLDAIEASDGMLTETHYQRSGYGKIQFDCDFGPTMFQEVRQAVAYLLNRAEFCQTFTGGYGVVVDGPYSPDFDMYKAVEDEIELIAYDYSPDNAKKVLEEGGWIYNSKGEPYVEGAEGVDAVRYKKLTAEEAAATNGVNKTYSSVANDDGITYQTVEINGEYYMPLAINWFGSQPNDVTDLLTTTLSNNDSVKAAGMVIRSTTGDFTNLSGNIYRNPSMGYMGVPVYGMYNLATGWPTAVYDYAWNWSLDPNYFVYSSNKLFDEYDKAYPYYDTVDAEGNPTHTKKTYEEAVAASGDKLGMDYLSMAMVYDATTTEEYNHWWMKYIERWNELMPDIPLYSNYYYDAYNSKIENFKTTPFWGPAQALVYANVANAAD